jgi:hypothetical protein
MRRLFALSLLAATAHAQFTLQKSNTTASLRGVENVDGRVAWASGTAGTVLRTLDGGTNWQTCAVPQGAEKLDFRAVQAFDAQTALVMSVGNGDSSRIYRTTDGCKTWKQVYANPDAPGGFFDALYFTNRNEGWLLGDPVNGSFFLAVTHDGGLSWMRVPVPALESTEKGGAFAASNQSLLVANGGPVFGGGGGLLFRGESERCPDTVQYNDPSSCATRILFRKMKTDVGGTAAAAGIFALHSEGKAMVAVGGNYTHPDEAKHAAAFSVNEGMGWQPAETMPRGYRSTVAYDATTKTWIATGPTGTDISTDNGRNWKPLLPDATKGDSADSDRNWNALSLPFAVGPKGRIGRLRDGALTGK